MNLTDAFREPVRVNNLLRQIHQEAEGDYVFMEVCGGHTTAIRSFGIPGLLPDNIRLISGPGCPVCVTSTSYIDHAILLCSMPEIIIATFGDLLRVPGRKSSLEKEKSAGADVNIVYSVNEAINLAQKYNTKKIVFLAIGFETTAPGTAAGVMEVINRGVENFFIFSAHKIMPPAMRAVVQGGTNVGGFICPGHVSAITGSGAYHFLPEDFGIGCVVSGFEPVDILQSVLMLVRQVNQCDPKVEVQYTRAVKPEGNQKAVKLMDQVFDLSEEWWRGFGNISGSGLRLKSQFECFDARKVFSAIVPADPDEGKCICGEILRGRSTPSDCPLFADGCTPGDPAGACMVSSEGACNVYYKYRNYA